jgi:EAL domain-containing protein (putative c-di-GMP-specific phosphodiesterase class I)
LLKAVGEQLSRECAKYPETLNLVTRIRGGEFAVLAPGLVREEALQLAQNLDSALASLHATGATDVASVASIGLAPFVYGDSPQAVLGLGDQALAQAEGQGDSSWVCLDHSASASVGDDHHAWHKLLDQALNLRRFELYFQPVVAAQDTQLILHYKVLSRLIDDEGQTIPAGRFLPWLERFGWTARLDRLMLELVLEQMAGHKESLALNLSSTTLADPQALNKVFEILRQHSDFGARLTLEIGEEQLPEQAMLEELTRRLRELGFSLSLQRFGGRFSMIGNLARLGLAYLKIDGSYIRAIDQESDKRLFIEAIQRAAHSIDLPLIAERVETEGELMVIREMGLYGVQGQLFGEPKPWQ